MSTLATRCLERKEDAELAYSMKTYKNLPAVLNNLKTELAMAKIPEELGKIGKNEPAPDKPKFLGVF
jgi:hypothetical protein